MTMKSLDQHIEATPGVAGGKPRIAGHRITVADIAIWHERMGKGADEIAAEYDLSLADIYAAPGCPGLLLRSSFDPRSTLVRPSFDPRSTLVRPSFDPREEIDRRIEASKLFAEALR